MVRGSDLVRVYGGGRADQLPARGELGWHLKALVERGAVVLVRGFAATAVHAAGGGLVLEGDTTEGPRRVGPVDRIVAACREAGQL